MKKRLITRLVASLTLVFSTFLNVNFAPLVGALDQDCTWTGATNSNFSTASNWTGCGGSVPGTGDNIVLNVTSLSSSATVNNDISGLSLKQIRFTGTTSNYSSYTISGNPITVTSGVSLADSLFATISANLVFSGPVTLQGNGQSGLSLNGVVSGSGAITVNGGSAYFNGVNTFTGNVTAGSGAYIVSSGASSLGVNNTVTANDTASVGLGSCNDGELTFSNNFVLNGSGAPFYGTTKEKLSTGAFCSGSGNNADEDYEQRTPNASQGVVLNGSMTLGSDVTFNGAAKTTTINGAFSGAHTFVLTGNAGGALIVNSSNNSSQLPNGTYNPTLEKTLSDNAPNSTVYIGENAKITIDGTRSDVNVDAGGTLLGNGTVGALQVLTGGTVAPGHSPGCLTTGNLALTGGTYKFEIGGTAACTGYDQIKANGTVNVTGGVLSASLYNNYAAKAGEKYVLVSNDGTDPIVGTFANLAQGATMPIGNGGLLRISYTGGDGNDIEVTVVTAPTVPNTGFELLSSNPIATLVATTAAALALLYIGKRRFSRQ